MRVEMQEGSVGRRVGFLAGDVAVPCRFTSLLLLWLFVFIFFSVRGGLAHHEEVRK